MVLQANFAKRIVSNMENTPPSLQLNAKGFAARVQSTIQDASRRRRARNAGTSQTPKYAVEQAKRRSHSKAKSSVRFIVTTTPTPVANDVEMKDASPTATRYTTRTFPVNFPRELARPEFKEVSQEAIRAVDSTLMDTDIEHIRESIEILGPDLLKSLGSVKANPIKDRLPKELEIIVNDMTAILPTHMLAVFGKQAATGDAAKRPRKVTLFPVHSLVFAAQCANLPKFPSTLPVELTQEGPQRLEVPIWSLCIPSPLTYPQLSRYLYTKRTEGLFKALLPCPPPPAFEHTPAEVLNFATHLAGTFTVQALVKHTLTVHGLWQNVCALGVFDDQLWDAMDLMWETLLTAIAIGTGNPGAMIPGEQAS
ncbi:clampless1 Clp1 protein [Crassisporium funariophilum]|nr:clampless1 Clp1 protein [Crassisporium funariophilum]